MRLSYPTNIKIMKVPCTGRVDIIHVLKAFENGADGVYIVGCLEGDCHFLVGNVRAKKRVEYVKKLLDESGIGGERVAMYNMSAAEGQRFAEAAREMTKKIRALGPNPVKKQWSSDQVAKDSSENLSNPGTLEPSNP
jgi:F420-non-reducing hydrogenase iron-sulfur subunit